MRAAPDQLKWVVDDVIPHTVGLEGADGGGDDLAGARHYPRHDIRR